MSKTFAIALTLALAVGGGALAKDKAPGVKCGNSYIAAGKTCHKPDEKLPVCKVGKACGKSCIAKDKECHIK